MPRVSDPAREEITAAQLVTNKTDRWHVIDDSVNAKTKKMRASEHEKLGTVLLGSGSPESVVAASPGKWYRDTSTTPALGYYLKLSGDSSTGWSQQNFNLPIDDVLSGVGGNAVENQAIKAYVDKVALMRPGDEVYVGSGNSGDDATGINTAIDQLNTNATGGTMWIAGEWLASQEEAFDGANNLLGLTPDAAIKVTHRNALFRWGDYWTGKGGAGKTAITATAAFATQIHSPSQSFEEGDLIVVMSDDNIANVHTHYDSGNQRPMEIHQIYSIPEFESDIYRIGGFIVDALTTNQEVVKVPIMARPGSNRSDVRIGDFTLRQADEVHDGALFDIRRLNGLDISGVRWELNGTQGGPGHMLVTFCTDVNFHHNSCDGMEDYNTYVDGSYAAYGYCFVVGVVNRWKVHHNTFRRAAHYVTSTAGYSAGVNRWGTPRNGLISNNLASLDYSPVDSDHVDPKSFIAFDMHPEGWGTVFDSNYVEIAGAAYPSLAFSTRARKTIFTNNKVVGSGACKGIFTYADDCTIAGNVFLDVWQPVAIINDQAARNNTTVVNNVFDGGIGSAGRVIIQGGDRHKVAHNIFRDNSACCVRVDDGDYIDITHNEFINTGSSDTEGVISFGGSSSNCNVTHNMISGSHKTPIEFLGTGTGNKVTMNSFRDCASGLPLIKFTGGSGHRVSMNDAPKMVNASFIDVGDDIGEADITIVGNAADGYSGLGVAGTNAGAINATWASKNFTS